jgi:hypothetical protein
MMVCSQIHAPATLPNPIHMHLLNRTFLAILYCLETLCFFSFYSKQLQPTLLKNQFMLAGVLAGWSVSYVISLLEPYVNT